MRYHVEIESAVFNTHAQFVTFEEAKAAVVRVMQGASDDMLLAALDAAWAHRAFVRAAGKYKRMQAATDWAARQQGPFAIDGADGNTYSVTEVN